MNTETLNNNEITMFGTTAANVERSFATAYNINMRLAGMLSDVQELLSSGNNEEANQLINQVKYCIFEFTDTCNLLPAQKQD
jgi:hypothetical protein